MKINASNKLLSLIEDFPDWKMCFILGFLTSGILYSCLNYGVEAFFDLLEGDVIFKPESFVAYLFLYGLPAGFITAAIGYALKTFKMSESKRALMLCLLLPSLALIFSCVQSEAINIFKGNGNASYASPDLLLALGLNISAGLLSSLIAVLTMYIHKLSRKVFSKALK